MRSFPFITVGQVLNELNAELEKTSGKSVKLTRPTYYRLEKRLQLPMGKKTHGGWRTFTREDVEEIKKRIKEEYNISTHISIQQDSEKL